MQAVCCTTTQLGKGARSALRSSAGHAPVASPRPGADEGAHGRTGPGASRRACGPVALPGHRAPRPPQKRIAVSALAIVRPLHHRSGELPGSPETPMAGRRSCPPGPLTISWRPGEGSFRAALPRTHPIDQPSAGWMRAILSKMDHDREDFPLPGPHGAKAEISALPLASPGGRSAAGAIRRTNRRRTENRATFRRFLARKHESHHFSGTKTDTRRTNGPSQPRSTHSGCGDVHTRSASVWKWAARTHKVYTSLLTSAIVMRWSIRPHYIAEYKNRTTT